MRPHRPTHVPHTNKAIHLTLRRDLDWMSGYPVSPCTSSRHGSITWQVCAFPGKAEQRHINRHDLRRSQGAWNTLQSRPKLLAQLCRERSQYIVSVEALFKLLNKHLHAREPLPDHIWTVHPWIGSDLQKRASRLCRHAPALLPLIRATAWISWTTPQRFKSHLACLEQEQRAFTSAMIHGGPDIIPCLIRILHYADELGFGLLIPYCQLFETEGFWTGIHSLPEDFISRCCSKIHLTPDLVPELTDQLPGKERLDVFFVSWLQSLSTLSREQRRRCLRLGNLLIEGFCFPEWHHWLQSANRTHHALRMASLYTPGMERYARMQQYREHLNDLATHMPFKMTARAIRLLLQELPQRDSTYCDTIIALAGQWPAQVANRPLRIHITLLWAGHWSAHLSKQDYQSLKWHLAAMTRYAVRNHHSIDMLRPWSKLFKRQSDAIRWGDAPFDNRVKDEFHSVRHAHVFYEALSLALGHNIDTDLTEFCNLVPLCRYFTADEVHRIWLAADAESWNDNDLPLQTTKFCACLADSEPITVAHILNRLSQMDIPGYDLDEPLVHLYQQFKEHGHEQQFLSYLIHGEAQHLHGLIKQLIILVDAKQRLPQFLWETCTTKEPDWIQQYPCDLARPLTALANLDPKAEQTAARLLGKYITNQHRLAMEIHFLRALPEHSQQQAKRLTNLRKRRQEQGNLSPEQVQKATQCLQLAVTQRQLRLWSHELQTNTNKDLLTIATNHASTSIVPWPAGWQKLVTAMATFPARDRKLLTQILRLRAGPKPWDMRDAAANKRFLDNMQGRGLKMQAWLQHFQHDLWIPGPNSSRHLTIAPCQDPIEIWRMGAHFRTCLSPHDCNYWSVLANCVDINKHVLYAKDQHGKVHARMLIALTDTGGLLSFYHYAHDHSDTLVAAFDALLNQLAMDLNTILVPHGTVSNLVAHRWYNDGPRNLGQDLAAFAEQSPWQQQLMTLPSDHVIAHCQQALAPHGITELTAPLLLKLDVWTEHPRVFAALLPALWPVMVPLRFVLDPLHKLIHSQTGFPRDKTTAWLARLMARHDYHGSHWLKPWTLLGELSPKQLIRSLQQLAAKGNCSRQDSRQGWRQHLLGTAYEKLDRLRKARLHYQIGAQDQHDNDSSKACQRALLRLQRQNGKRIPAKQISA